MNISNSVPQTAATTFACSSVFILLVWLGVWGGEETAGGDGEGEGQAAGQDEHLLQGYDHHHYESVKNNYTSAYFWFQKAFALLIMLISKLLSKSYIIYKPMCHQISTNESPHIHQWVSIYISTNESPQTVFPNAPPHIHQFTTTYPTMSHHIFTIESLHIKL